MSHHSLSDGGSPPAGGCKTRPYIVIRLTRDRAFETWNKEAAVPVLIPVKTTAGSEMVDITSSVQKEISNAGVSDGICVVYVPHTTAGITINEGADPSVCRDITEKLNDLVPRNAGYHHMEGNADSHIKASLMGSSVSVMLEGGRLLLGTWQKIFFCEFDGPRSRKVYVQFQRSL